MKKKVIRLTESDLTRMVNKVIKETKNKRKLNESSEDVDDLKMRFFDILNDLEDFINDAENVIDRHEFGDNETEGDIDISILDGYVRDTYEFLEKF